MANNGNWMPRSAYLPIMRKHVTLPSRWAHEAGTDFWLLPAPDMNAAEDTGSQEQLPEWGWTSTSLVDTAGSGADFMSSVDKGIPNHILTNASGDILGSPAIFGDYSHAFMAQQIAGMAKLPTKLICEFWGAMSVHSADEPTSGWGLFEDGATISTEADQIAFISSDSSNFQLAANGGSGALTDAGDADDALWHFFGIELNLADDLAYWYIDDPSRTSPQGSVAITADEFPAKFGMHALTTNRPLLGITHIFYEW